MYKQTIPYNITISKKTVALFLSPWLVDKLFLQELVSIHNSFIFGVDGRK